MNVETEGVRASFESEEKTVTVSFGYHSADISHRAARVLGTALIEMAKEAEQ